MLPLLLQLLLLLLLLLLLILLLLLRPLLHSPIVFFASSLVSSYSLIVILVLSLWYFSYTLLFYLGIPSQSHWHPHILLVSSFSNGAMWRMLRVGRTLICVHTTNKTASSSFSMSPTSRIKTASSSSSSFGLTLYFAINAADGLAFCRF